MLEQDTLDMINLSSDDKIEKVISEIQRHYLMVKKPWLIGFSGGKDSTAVLQLFWSAIEGIPAGLRENPIYVISSDTLVESPPIKKLIETTIKNVNEVASERGLPFEGTIVRPKISETFWVNLIGRGYPTPSQKFRWCTDRLKIKPTNRYIIEKISEFGEVIVVLAVRKGESASRDQTLEKRKHNSIEGSPFYKNHYFPSTAFFYTPILDFDIEDVWEFLLLNKNPWGGDNHALFELYKTADGGECPLVMDDTVPPCGNSRFGCWVCTLVKEDKSMKELVKNGPWMKPLLDFRRTLVKTQNPKNKSKYRGVKRRTGHVSFNSNGSGQLVRGPYYLWFRKKLLERLLKVQIKLKEKNPDFDGELISKEELIEIQWLWKIECGDSGRSVREIYKTIMERDLEWSQDDTVDFSEEDELLKELCKKFNIPLEIIRRLIEEEKIIQGISGFKNIVVRIEGVLDEEWREEEEITQTVNIGMNRDAI